MSPPSDPSFFDGLRDFVTRGETGVALEQLRNYLKTNAVTSDRNVEVRLHSLAWNDLEKRERRGLITPVEMAVERARISRGVLQFIDVVEKDARSTPTALVPYRVRSVEYNPSAALAA